MTFSSRLYRLAASKPPARLNPAHKSLWEEVAPLRPRLRRMGYRATASRDGRVQLRYKDMDVTLTFVAGLNVEVSSVVLNTLVATAHQQPFNSPAFLVADIWANQFPAFVRDVEERTLFVDALPALKRFAQTLDRIDEMMENAGLEMSEYTSE